jgi:hypothetical protein
MKRKGIIIGVISIIFLIISSATAVPNVQNKSIDKILENKKNMKLLENKIIDFNNLINLILKILGFIQNLTSVALSLLAPFLPLLEKLTTFMENLLEKLEPWGILGQAILDVIDAINALIEAIQNIINPPQVII